MQDILFWYKIFYFHARYSNFMQEILFSYKIFYSHGRYSYFMHWVNRAGAIWFRWSALHHSCPLLSKSKWIYLGNDIWQTFISLEFICLISVTSQIRFKLNLFGKNLVTERWQTTKYLSSFQQQLNFCQALFVKMTKKDFLRDS